MTFKGLIIQSNDSSYTGKSGRVERQTLVCLDAEPVKLKNTVDIQLTREDLAKIKGEAIGQTVEFEISDAEFFAGRLRLTGKPRIQQPVK
jgi:RNase P/RNase MRP subunit p29